MEILISMICCVLLCGSLCAYTYRKILRRCEHFRSAVFAALEKHRMETEQKLRELENGLSPNYEAQKAAKEAVDSFNEGIAGILGFDPFEAIRNARKGKGDTEE